MPELDDAALERRLRGVLKEHLDALPLDLTVDDLARRREAMGGGGFGRRRGLTLLAAAALLLVGGALAAGSGFLRLPSVVPPVPAPSLVAVATASPDATTSPTPSASEASPAPLGLDVTWTQLPLDSDLDILSAQYQRGEQSPRLAWLGDRFVLTDVKSGAVRTSTDGQDWQVPETGETAQGYLDLLRGSFASWQDQAVGWWNPQENDGPEVAGTPPITDRDVVRVVRPPAAPTQSTPFKGRIESIGVGPKGIVAQVHSDLDWDAWVTKKLGLKRNNDWTCCVKEVTFEDGVLQIKLRNRPGLKVVWADEGLEPGDYQDRGFGWYSPDGEQWTAMAASDHPSWDPESTLPTGGLGSVVGVSDGFIATGAFPESTCTDPNGSCTGMWFSSDGLTWRFLGVAPSGSQRLLPWRGGALATSDDGHTAVWTSGGSEELPIATRLRDTVATGPLGIVSIGDGQVLVSRDGIDDKLSPLPAEMADAASGWGPGGSNVVAVGDRSVLVLEIAKRGEFTMTQSLWLGTFEP